MSDGEVRPFLRKTYQNLFQIPLDISPECFLLPRSSVICLLPHRQIVAYRRKKYNKFVFVLYQITNSLSFFYYFNHFITNLLSYTIRKNLILFDSSETVQSIFQKIRYFSPPFLWPLPFPERKFPPSESQTGQLLRSYFFRTQKIQFRCYPR